MNQIKANLGTALCAIAAVQAVCLDADVNIAVYALDSAHQNIDTAMQVIERQEQMLINFAHYFEQHCDQSGEFDAENFLSEFADFSEAVRNGE